MESSPAGAPGSAPQPARALQDGKSPGAKLVCGSGREMRGKAPTTLAGAAAEGEDATHGTWVTGEIRNFKPLGGDVST